MKNIIFSITLLSLASTGAFANPPIASDESANHTITIAPKANSFFFEMPEEKIAEIAGLKQVSKPTNSTLTVDEEKAYNVGNSKKVSFFGSFYAQATSLVKSVVQAIKSVFGF